mgnify:CR=1 FL=1
MPLKSRLTIRLTRCVILISSFPESLHGAIMCMSLRRIALGTNQNNIVDPDQPGNNVYQEIIAHLQGPHQQKVL